MNRKYERELRELLEKMDGLAPQGRQRRAMGRWGRRAQWWLADFQTRIGRVRRESLSRQLMLLSYGLALVVFLLGGLLRPLASELGLVVATLFALAYLSAFLERRGASSQRRWRGQIIDYRRPQDRPWDIWLRRLRRWRW